jgi:hypothetical protein
MNPDLRCKGCGRPTRECAILPCLYAEMADTRYIVRRFRGQTLEKSYGPFDDEQVAGWVAQRAAEKHPRSIVMVEVFHGR